MPRAASDSLSHTAGAVWERLDMWEIGSRTAGSLARRSSVATRGFARSYASGERYVLGSCAVKARHRNVENTRFHRIEW